MNISISKSASLLVWSLLFSLSIPTLMIVYSQQTHLIEWNLLSMLSTPVIMTLILDPIGMMFSCTVLFISANVLMFSTVYMVDDKFIERFTVLVLLFILSMNLLIFIPHFMILLLGWDGLGIVSFILVIYYQNPKSLAAGMITALTNRIGDVMLLLSMAWTLNQGHWYILNMQSSSLTYMQVSAITLAAMTKSAQMPFSSWLPAAMAAPTPVSALVHSSTLVTAGVFLLIRFYPFLHTISSFNVILLCVAVSTMLMAGLSAISECDMKKIIALSTLSQLGMMMTSLGLNMPNLAFFHMVTHALFKALLFICAGSFINLHLHSQDLRWMGNLSNQMPVASSCISLANLALCGFPFMAGFYSKDMIMESALHNQNNTFMVFLSIMCIGLTSFYSIRLSVVTMWGPTLSAPFMSIKENIYIIMPMLLLSSCAITTGSLMSWIPPISSSMFLLPWSLKSLPTVLMLSGLIMAWYFTTILRPSSCEWMKIPITHHASCMMWYLTPLSSQFVMALPLSIAHHYLKSVDHGWLEQSSSQGLNKTLIRLTNNTLILQPTSPTGILAISMAFTLASMILILQ